MISTTSKLIKRHNHHFWEPDSNLHLVNFHVDQLIGTKAIPFELWISEVQATHQDIKTVFASNKMRELQVVIKFGVT